MAHRVYISASTQHANIGVGQYGTEQDRMQFLADRVKYWLETQKGQFTVFRNEPGWSLSKTVEHSNNLACELFLDNHSNAGKVEKVAGDGGAEGTVVFYYGQGGKDSNSYRLASSVYNQIAPLSPGKDRGVRPDTSLYSTGLYVVQRTKAPAALMEHFFHTNYDEVEFYLKNVDDFAKAEAKGICDYFDIQWTEASISSGGITVLVNGVNIVDRMDVKPYFVDGRVVVPIRFVAEALGCNVGWDNATKTVTLTRKEDK
jgi:N-acetylmuramoyl-L-alanine amidase